MFDNKKITFIGPGVMAEAMIAGLIRQEVAEPDMLLASGPREERVADLTSRYGIRALTDNAAAAREGDVVVLSVKPQRLDAVLEGLRGSIKSEALILSIVAGAPIAKISGILDHQAVIRAMPNTPAQIGEGISVWTATAEVTEKQREWASSILGAIGKEIYVDDEKYIDMATAVSGSGPAYFFFFHGGTG